MSPCLEVRQQASGHGQLCETCRLEAGPVRSARFAVFLCGHPADLVCGLHVKMWKAEFASDEVKAA